ncbi:MAG: lipopolysaccharide biosynthesis protein [Acidobacteria bacterium]|nr:lipopolysaccharide biosynthesis protein [Acidobacteriota bacterium]
MTETDAQRRQGRSSAWALIGTAVGAIANFALLLLVSARYGQTLFGIFAAVTALFQLSVVLFRLGAEVGATYSIGKLGAEQDSAHARAVIVAAVAPVLAVSTLIAAVAFAAAGPIAEFLTEPADTATYERMLRTIAIALPIAAVGEVLLGATRGFSTMRPTVLASNFGRQTGQLFTVAIAATFSERADLLAAAWALPYLCTVAYPAWWLRRVLRDLGPTTRRPPWRTFWRYTTPQAANAAVQGGLEKVDVIMLGRLGGADQTAVYSLANRFVHVVVLSRYALNASHSAEFAAGFDMGDTERVGRSASRVATWTALLCAPALFLLTIFPKTILGVVGESYEAGSASLQILAVTVLISLLLGPVEALLLMSGSSGRVLMHNAAALLLNLGLNAWLIPAHGPTGAAIAWGVSVMMSRTLSFFQLRRRESVSSTGTNLFSAMIAVTTTFGLGGLGARLVLGDDPLGLAVGATIGLISGSFVMARHSKVFRIDELIDGLRPRSGGNR